MRYARVLALHNGLDPRVIDDLPVALVRAWLAVEPILRRRDAVGGFKDP